MAAPTARNVTDPGRSTARNSVTAAGCMMVSRATGLVRVLVIGAVLGPTYFANVFQSGYVVPGLVFTVIAGPVLAMVVVPTLVRSATTTGLCSARRTVAHVAAMLLSASLALGVLLAVLAPLIAHTLTLGIDDEALRSRAQHLATILILLVAPQVVLHTAVALTVAVQQSRQRYALPAAAPAVENLGVIATVILSGFVYDTGLEVGLVPPGMVLLLGLGATASVLAHLAVQLVGTARAGMLVAPARGWRGDRDAVAVARRILGSLGVAACPAGAMYTLIAVAATVPGGVVVIQMSYAAYYTLLTFSARAVSFAALPRMADAANRADRAGFAASWRQAQFYAVLPSVPAMILLAAFAYPAADVLANGQLRQSPELIAALAGCLVVVAAAQAVGGLNEVSRQALFSRSDDRGPRRASAITFPVTAVTALVTLLLVDGQARLIGLVCALLLGELAGVAVQSHRLRTAIAPEPLADMRSLGRALLAGVSTVPVILGGRWFTDASELGRFGELGLVVACSLLASAGYACVLWVWTRGRGEPA